MAVTITRSHCRSCHAPLLWLRNERTQKVAPIEAETASDGNCEVNLEAGTYRIHTVTQATLPGVFPALHRNHFQSCPDAKRFRPDQKVR